MKGSAQNNDCLVDMNGIGALKIGMRQDEIEKLLKQKFVLRNAVDTAVSYNDTAMAKYKNSNVQLFFQRQYTAENTYFMYLIGLKTKSPLCKTGKGIGIGSDKLKIISAYETDYVFMRPEFEDEAFTKKSKTGYIIGMNNDNNDRQIVFYLKNKKVVAIEVNTIFNDEE